eukprot:278748_1
MTTVRDLNKDNLHLIPVYMKDMNGNVDVHYMMVMTLDSYRHLDIGVSFICDHVKDDKYMVHVSGIHLNPQDIEKSAWKHDLDGNILSDMKIEHLDIYTRTNEYYKDGFDQLKSFLRKFYVNKSSRSHKHWIEQAGALWKAVIDPTLPRN